MSERVLVFPAEILAALPKIENGITLDPIPYGEVIFNNPSTTFLGRDEAETNPDWKQVIPYMLIRHGDSYLVYQRTNNGGESRLHDKFSLGIGGHINDSDGIGVVEAYIYGMARELNEEIEVDASPDPSSLVAALYDDSTEVGRVHFGFVYIIRALSSRIVVKENTITNAVFMPIEFIKSTPDKFETWSKLVIEHLL